MIIDKDMNLIGFKINHYTNIKNNAHRTKNNFRSHKRRNICNILRIIA